MEDLEKKLLVNKLFDLYGNLLSLTQQKMIHLYYQLDLSLSEIAEQEEISRNAVFDALKKGIDSLKEYENKLHFLQKKEELTKKISNLKEKLDDKNYKIVIEEFKEVKDGI